MPLSEDEQKILTDIENHLYESDPALVREVSQTTVYTHAVRNLKWAALGVAVGFLMMILLLSKSYWFAFGGFLLMLGSVLWAERNARKLGRTGIDQWTQTMRAGGLRDAMGGAGAKMRDRFNRRDHPSDE